MSDCTFKAKITIKPSSYEFWPAGGWHTKGKGWARFYSCKDKQIVRRALVEPKRDGGWQFKVSEIRVRSILAVARQPDCMTAAEPTLCLHAADMAACGHRYLEVAHA